MILLFGFHHRIGCLKATRCPDDHDGEFLDERTKGLDEKRVLSPSEMLPCLCGCLCTMHRGIPLAIITLFAFFENDGPAMLLPKLDQVLNFIDFLEVGYFQALFFQPLFLVPFILNHCHGGSGGEYLVAGFFQFQKRRGFHKFIFESDEVTAFGPWQENLWIIPIAYLVFLYNTGSWAIDCLFDGVNDAAQTCRSHGLHSG